MAKVLVELAARDNASSVIDHVTKKLGVFNKEGIATGVSFALVTKAIDLAQQAIYKLGESFQKGMDQAKEFELNLVRITNTMKVMDMTTGELTSSLHEMSATYGVDVNSLAVGMKRLTREQNSATESMRMLNQAQLLSLASGEDLGSILDVLDTTMGVFDLDTKNSGYILEKVNAIINTTGLSVQDISDIFGRLSPEIRKAGYNLNDVVNILYTLAQTEIGPRKIAPAFEEYLKGMGFEKVKEVPQDAVKTVEEQANAIVNTHIKATDKIGIAWDNFWEDVAQGALETIDVLNMKWTPQEGWHKELTKLPGMGDVSAPKTNPFKDWTDSIKKDSTSIADLNTKLKESNDLLTQYTQEIGDLTAQRGFTVAMHDSTEAVREQEEAIEKLQRISDAYSLQQQQNNLELMKIQYGAMGRRGGKLTRAEQRTIADIDKENMGLQIKQAEQQLSIEQIRQNGLRQALDAQKQIQREHDQWVYETTIRDLDANIKAKNELYSTELTNNISINDQILAANQKFYNQDLLAYTRYIQAKRKIGGGSAGTTTSASGQTTPDTVNWLNQEYSRITNRRLGVPGLR